MKLKLFPILLIFLVPHLIVSDKTPCEVCRDLTKNFKKHFDATSGQNYGGGNTAWEEKSLGSYATSETRLVEILEKSSNNCDYKCSSLLEDQEEALEEWFFNNQKSDPDIFMYLCVNKLKRCCDKNRFGKECQECPGGVEKPCNGHGKCDGEGDRQGKGTCTCDRGYNGTICEDCNTNFIRATDDSCEECSSLCKGQCISPGRVGCTECIKGYELIQDEGCKDINECERDGCGDPLETCVNSPGTFECICKDGYHRVKGKCQLEDLYADENEADDEDITNSKETESETVSEIESTESANDQENDKSPEELMNEIKILSDDKTGTKNEL